MAIYEWIIVGDPEDPHVEAVRQQLSFEGLVVNASTLFPTPYRLSPDTLSCGNDQLSLSPRARGWIRRIAPDDFADRLRLGSHDAVVKSARLAVLTAFLRTANVRWLSQLDQLLAAEEKMVQYAAAVKLAIPIPRTVVTSDVAILESTFGSTFVLKPIGPGQFVDSRHEVRSTFATEVAADDIADIDIAAAPFIAQERLAPDTHFRVVVVGDRCWTFYLAAFDYPLDWRRADSAHESFSSIETPHSLGRQAIALARALGAGFSSQDWCSVNGTYFFLDLNPAGQWLFLSSSEGDEIASAIAGYLEAR